MMMSASGRCADSYVRALLSYWEGVKYAVEGDPDKLKERLTTQRINFIEWLSGFTSCTGGRVLERLSVRDCGPGFTHCVVVEARLLYRARPGSGQPPPPLELGVVLHPVWLVPYIPGSSVKGALRSLLYSLLVEHLGERGVEESDARRSAERCVAAFFGRSSDNALAGVGGVVAYDAYPVRPGVRGLLVIGDVVTPHYGGDRVVEMEHQAEPRPAQGVSVAEGTVFRFLVGVDADYVAERLRGEEGRCLGVLRGLGLGEVPGSITFFVAGLLSDVLSYIGIGGKTTRGYGVFEVDSLRVVDQRRRWSRACLPRSARRRG